MKYEYIAGEIVVMSGGTIAHGRLIGRTADALNRALDGKRCIVLPSDLRVRIRSAERSTYADLHIVYGEIERDPDDDHASRGRETNGDRGDLVGFDRGLGSDRKVRRLPPPSVAPRNVLVSQRERRVEVYRRDVRRWHLDEYGPGEQLTLDSLAIALVVDEIMSISSSISFLT